MWYVIGLGNPGDEYEGTRHNIGRDVVSALAKKFELNFKEEGKAKSHFAKGSIGKKPSTLLLPDVFMNESGKVAKFYIKNKKDAKNLIVVRDDIDMGLGTMKLTFNRGSGGHRGTESVLGAIKTSEFYQLKIGVLPLTPSGKIKKPKGDKKVIEFILGEWKKDEEKLIKKEIKRAGEAIEALINEGFGKSASNFNG
ncbi:MAG: aminoacyl-tRNA hydrolase [Minisyncoccia bacterium]